MTEPERPLEALESDWAALAVHHQRGALFLVAAGVDLVVVARAVAGDAVDEVRGHLESGRLGRASEEEVALFASAPHEHLFRFCIVQPYVVAQRLVS